ncbi:hypothetical protein GGI20_005471 [Coemansia sp. BCRC 34301]|nr:hypothetical protein GGI20_005471 [Coemansia sp. BCRC 34301]
MFLSLDQVHFYHAHGYLIVEPFLTDRETQLYRDEAQQLTNHCYEQGDIVANWGCIVEPLGCGYYDDDAQVTQLAKSDRASYIALRAYQPVPSPALPLCTLDKFGQCARQLLHASNVNAQQSVYLLNEQYIVKPPRSPSAEFAWHQDVLYFSETQRKHAVVSAWTPLNSVSSVNGTVLVEPFPDPTNPGVYECNPGGRDTFAAKMEAGSVLFMDGRLRHCSSGNHSAAFRLVFMPQFSLGRIARTEDAHAALAIPLGPTLPC